MTIPPNQREARDIVTLVELIALDPDPMPAEHMDSIVAAGRAVAGYVRRAKLGQEPTLGLHGQPLAPDGTVDVRAYVKRLDDDWNRGAGPMRP